MKSASLTSALLSMKGRASPARLIDKLVNDLGGTAPGGASEPESGRWEAADQARMDYQRPIAVEAPKARMATLQSPFAMSAATAKKDFQPRHDYQKSPRIETLKVMPAAQHAPAVVPMPNTRYNVERRVADPNSRKKLSVRLEHMSYMKLKLAAIHLGLSAQDLITRALDQYIESVTPQFAQTVQSSAVGQAPTTVRAGGSDTKGHFAPAPEVMSTS